MDFYFSSLNLLKCLFTLLWGTTPTFEVVRELVQPERQPRVAAAWQLNSPTPQLHLQLARYDQLLSLSSPIVVTLPSQNAAVVPASPLNLELEMELRCAHE